MAIRLLADVQAGHADAEGADAADEVQKPEMLLDLPSIASSIR